MSRKGLMEQNLSKLDVNQLNPLSPEVISRQATINIGKFMIIQLSAFFQVFDTVDTVCLPMSW